MAHQGLVCAGIPSLWVTSPLLSGRTRCCRGLALLLVVRVESTVFQPRATAVDRPGYSPNTRVLGAADSSWPSFDAWAVGDLSIGLDAWLVLDSWAEPRGFGSKLSLLAGVVWTLSLLPSA